MASATVSKALISDTDANFRLWGKAISDQLATSWTQTADSGQINWSTVTAPVASNTAQGYEIWESNDASGSIVNIYLKIEYGSSNGAANQPAIWITIGWGSDGSGNLTGTTSTRSQIGVRTTASSSVVTHNLGVGTGWIAMVLGTATNLGFYFSIERTRNSSLQYQNEVLVLMGQQSAAGGPYYSQVVNQSTAYTQESVTNSMMTSAVVPVTANAIVGTTVGLGLWFGCKGGFSNPSMNLFSCSTGQLGSVGNTLSLTTYGSSHTYIVNNNACHFFAGKSAAAGGQVLSRFE